MKSQPCLSLKDREDGTTAPRIPLGQSIALPHLLTTPLAVRLCKRRSGPRRAEQCWWCGLDTAFAALVCALRLSASRAFLPSERPPCGTRSPRTYKPEASMGYSGFARGVFPSADCTFELAMLTEERLRAVRGDRMRQSESPVALVRSSGVGPFRGPRCNRPGVRTRDLPSYPRGSPARWRRFGFGGWMNRGEAGGGAGSPNVDYLVFINWI